MTKVLEAIPEALQGEVDAALAFWNQRQDLAFEVTGILDPEAALAQTGKRELRLVLCGGDRCEQRSFRVAEVQSGYVVTDLDDDAQPAATRETGATPQPELDPPPGAMRGWLDRALAQHAFVVLVFYRGFW